MEISLLEQFQPVHRFQQHIIDINVNFHPIWRDFNIGPFIGISRAFAGTGVISQPN